MQDYVPPALDTPPVRPAWGLPREVLGTLVWLGTLMVGPYLAVFLLGGLTLGIMAGLRGDPVPQMAKAIALQLTPPALAFWLCGLFAAVLMVMLCRVLAARRFGAAWQASTGARAISVTPRLLGLLLLFLAGYLLWAGLVASVLQAVWPSQVIMPEITKSAPANGIGVPLAFLFLAVAAPIAEESIFRGYVLARLGTVLLPVQAIVAAAVLFGLAHFNGGVLHPFVTLYLGLVTGWLRFTYGSLVPGMLLHGMVNSLAVAAMLAH